LTGGFPFLQYPRETTVFGNYNPQFEQRNRLLFDNPLNRIEGGLNPLLRQDTYSPGQYSTQELVAPTTQLNPRVGYVPPTAGYQGGAVPPQAAPSLPQLPGAGTPSPNLSAGGISNLARAGLIGGSLLAGSLAPPKVGVDLSSGAEFTKKMREAYIARANQQLSQMQGSTARLLASKGIKGGAALAEFGRNRGASLRARQQFEGRLAELANQRDQLRARMQLAADQFNTQTGASRSFLSRLAGNAAPLLGIAGLALPGGGLPQGILGGLAGIFNRGRSA
jgi:hypothetical protein